MFPSSKDHSVSMDATWRITVHDFVAVGGASTSRTVLQLEQGRDLAVACSSSDRWVTPRLTIDPSAFSAYRIRWPSLCTLKEDQRCVATDSTDIASVHRP